jgi:Tol biopolymer transport system component/DNA-binding winged helix-turn-helix (wHTH) protein
MSAPSDVVRFSVFELDRRAGELRKAGVRLGLQPQPLQVLSMLLERTGDLVTREELRKQLWPDDTFVDFQHGLNAAVNRLRETLGDSAETPRFIETLPRRGYRFIGSVDATGAASQSGERTPDSAEPRPAGVRPHHRWLTVGAAIAVVAVGLAAWAASRGRDSKEAPMRVVPLTTLRGHELWPTFSPDGSQVAFAWGGEKGDNFDIYVKLVNRPEVRRLTSDPLPDLAPSWSPDGQQIAYVRATAPPTGFDTEIVSFIHVMSALGGSDRKVSETPVSPPLAWAPDGNSLAARTSGPHRQRNSGIDLFPVRGGEPRALTRATPPATQVLAPAFSPDGRHLAYASCVGTHCQIEVLELDERLVAKGPRTQLTQHRPNIYGLSSIAWTPDGRFLLYSSLGAGAQYLWKVAADGSGPAERLELAGAGAIMPTSSAKNQLAFTRQLYDTDVYRFHPGGPAELVVGSTSHESGARFSPDGRHVAFSSTRSAERADIWIADGDGSNPRQLTHGPNLGSGSPSWSPDGSQIAFDSFSASGYWNIWVVGADGGRPWQVTRMTGQQVVPTWSRDGKWIYFAGGAWDAGFAIWRIPVGGGQPQRMTPDRTGRFATETADGRHLVYQAADADSPLMLVALMGGRGRQLVACAKNAAFGVGTQGVYYVPCEVSADPPLRLLDVQTGEDRLLGPLEGLDQSSDVPSLGLSVSPDGMSVLYPRNVTDTSDLMLIENFR